MYQRFSEMVSLVQTPYVCIMGDDEYFIPSALLECCTFLDCNQDFVSCMGRAVGFSSYKDRVIVTNIYERLRDRTLSATDPFTRLKNHFSSYVPSHTYAVTRLDVFKKAIHEASSSELDIFAIKELIHEFTVSSLGKSAVLPSLYWLRCLDVPPMRNSELSLDPSKSFTNWWKSSRNNYQKKLFCRKLSMIPGCCLSEDQVEDIFQSYVNCFTNFSSRFIPIFSSLLYPLKIFITKIAFAMNFIFLKSTHIFPLVSLLRPHALRRLSSQGVSIDYHAYSQCLASIRNSSQL